MKIVITGQNGYVANKLAQYLSEKSVAQMVETINLRDGIENIPLENVDVCIHCAALVHKKEGHYRESDYFRVNTELTIELAKKAKQQGVSHFIFLSTMAVYGMEKGEIHSKTSLQPQTFYGKSKLAAEKALSEMETTSFIVSIVRPPMIYGPSSPGNYASLRKLAKLTPVFPSIPNKRSMLFIDHLSECIAQLIRFKDSGVFHPQDAWYMNTSLLVKEIASQHKHSLFSSKMIGNLIMLLLSKKSIVNKVFGNLIYAKELSTYRDNSYQMYSFKEAITRTEDRG